MTDFTPQAHPAQAGHPARSARSVGSAGSVHSVQSAHNLGLQPKECGLLAACLGLLLLALLSPAAAQFANYHAFADQRGLADLPHAMDVLSNLPFLALGVWGLIVAQRAAKGAVSFARGADNDARAQYALSQLFFGGLVLTAVCSGFYHWAPDDLRLGVDRIGMVAAFAGLLGLAAATRISARAGLALAGAVLVLGPVSVAHWLHSGNVLPWGVLQFGGMGLIVAMASVRQPQRGSALPIQWLAVIALYAVAKGLELADAQVFALSGGWVSGHSLKHMVAAAAALPVLAAWRVVAQRGLVAAVAAT